MSSDILRSKSLFITLTLILASIAGCVGDSPSEHIHGEEYKGTPLTSGNAGDFTLIDQNGENYTLSSLKGDIVVVSFIFTRCTDTCPLITSKLRTVVEDLGDDVGKEVHFVSISMDPQYDTAERLNAYTDLHRANWPHLTGSQEDLQQVWDNFGVQVDQTFIDSHVKKNLVSILYPDNTTESITVMNDDLPTEAKAWNLTTESLETRNISLNYSYHEQYGYGVNGINGIDAPEWDANDPNYWYWSLLVWNSSNATWESSNLGASFLEVGPDTHIAWAANSSNLSLLPNPEMMTAHSHSEHEDSNHSNHSEGNDSHSGDNHSNHSDENNSHSGHDHSNHEDSNSSENNSDSEHDDHMHTHSVSDEIDDDSSDQESIELTNYTIGHNTVTFILDEELDKRIAFLGDSWDEKHLMQDIETLLAEPSKEEHSTPSIGIVFTILSMLGALLFLERFKSK